MTSIISCAQALHTSLSKFCEPQRPSEPALPSQSQLSASSTSAPAPSSKPTFASLNERLKNVQARTDAVKERIKQPESSSSSSPAQPQSPSVQPTTDESGISKFIVQMSEFILSNLRTKVTKVDLQDTKAYLFNVYTIGIVASGVFAYCGGNTIKALALLAGLSFFLGRQVVEQSLRPSPSSASEHVAERIKDATDTLGITHFTPTPLYTVNGTAIFYSIKNPGQFIGDSVFFKP